MLYWVADQACDACRYLDLRWRIPGVATVFGLKMEAGWARFFFSQRKTEASEWGKQVKADKSKSLNHSLLVKGKTDGIKCILGSFLSCLSSCWASHSYSILILRADAPSCQFFLLRYHDDNNSIFQTKIMPHCLMRDLQMYLCKSHTNFYNCKYT